MEKESKSIWGEVQEYKMYHPEYFQETPVPEKVSEEEFLQRYLAMRKERGY